MADTSTTSADAAAASASPPTIPPAADANTHADDVDDDLAALPPPPEPPAPDRPAWLPSVAVAVAALASAALVVRGTQFGLGLTPDGLTYIGVARNLADGHGLTGPVAQIVDQLPPADAVAEHGHTPLLRWPPLYPLLLGALSWLTRADALGVARALAVVLAAVNVVLIAAVIRRWSGSWTVGTAVALFVGVDPLFVHIHTLGASEPLFIAATLTCVLMTDRWLTEPRPWLLVAASATAGAAWLTRFSGVAVVAALAVTVAIASRRCLADAARNLAVVTVAALPAVAWLVRVELSPYAENHRAARPLEPDKARAIVDNVAAWFVPSGRADFSPSTGTGWLLWPIALAAVLVAAAGARHLRRRGVLPGLTALFGVAVVVSTDVWVRPIPVTGRMLLPVQPLVMGLAVTAAVVGIRAVAARQQQVPVAQAAAVGVGVLSGLLMMNGARQLGYVQRPVVPPPAADAALDGWLDELPEEVVVFSNDPAEVYGTYGRPAAALPSTAWQESGVANEGYDRQADDVVRLIAEGRAAVVLFSVGEFFNPTLPASGFFSGEGFTVTSLGPASVVRPGPPHG